MNAFKIPFLFHAMIVGIAVISALFITRDATALLGLMLMPQVPQDTIDEEALQSMLKGQNEKFDSEYNNQSAGFTAELKDRQ